MLQQDLKNLFAKIANKTQSYIMAKLLDPKMLDTFLNSVNASFKSENGGRKSHFCSSKFKVLTSD